MENQNNQLLLLRLLRTRSSWKQLLSKKYWCGIYSFIYTLIVLVDHCDPPQHWPLQCLCAVPNLHALNLNKRRSVTQQKNFIDILDRNYNCDISPQFFRRTAFSFLFYCSTYFRYFHLEEIDNICYIKQGLCQEFETVVAYSSIEENLRVPISTVVFRFK